MTSMDKAGIVIAIAIVVAAVGFTATGGSGSPSDITPVIEKSTTVLKETGQVTSQKLQEIKESGTKVMEGASETAKQAVEKTKQAVKDPKELGDVAKELATSKLPARLVSIPAGTSIPGCEEIDLCYDPPTLIIFKGGEVIWKNNDNNAHTVTSGNILEGPSGVFDSGLIKSGETFSFRFENTGEYQYFCMIHPWANASVTVK